ncbi:outer dynein arm-docking complex subunit 3-like [Dromaius novaehollandiae]|uniref:outer dynein arm-docking complex subunit 3-like n=1 Tax=Dromaius novaehollandiae TaxID=8790 RepID=UPI00311FFD03
MAEPPQSCEGAEGPRRPRDPEGHPWVRVRRLDALRHALATRRARLGHLQRLHRGHRPPRRPPDAAPTLQGLEGRLEAARLRAQEAERLGGLYRCLRAHLEVPPPMGAGGLWVLGALGGGS